MSEKETYNDFESLCAGYVLNALTDKERTQFEQMLKNADNEQQTLYHQMIEARDEMALATDAPLPSADIFDSVLAQISGDSVSQSSPAIEKTSSIIPLWAYKAAAAILLVGVLGLALFNLQLTETVDEKLVRITQLETELDQRNELLAILESREVNMILMTGLDVNPDGYGKVIWDTENQRALLQLANLPQPPSDKDYQLWLIKDDQDPISAGVFSFDQPSTGLFFKVEELREDPSDIMNTFAVTIEPKGGVPQPTGDMYLVGQEN